MMIAIQQQRLSADRHHHRWQTLTRAEKILEFQELVTSPYWDALPEEIKARIQNLIDNIPPGNRG